MLVSVPAAADPPSREDIRSARQLHRQARRFVRRGDWGEAARLLGEAEALHPTYIYAFELAKGHRETNSLPAAWRAVRRAQAYEAPRWMVRRLERFVTELEEELLAEHAFIKLADVPENADVRINNGQWLPPYIQWVERSFSHIEIEHPNFIAIQFNWHHAEGRRHQREVHLVPRSSFGRFRIEGTPAEAEVLLDGSSLGRLPTVQSELLAPGEYSIRVQHPPEFDTWEGTVTVEAGGVKELQVTLEPSASAFERLVQTQSFWGWTAAGTGGAMWLTGVILLGHASSLASDTEELNRSHNAGYADYNSRYDETTASIPGLSKGGWILFTVGLALAGTGTTLLLLDDDEESDTADTEEPPWRLAPYGAGLGAEVTF